MKNAELKQIINDNKILKKRKENIIINNGCNYLKVSYTVTHKKKGLLKKRKVVIIAKKLRKRYN